MRKFSAEYGERDWMINNCIYNPFLTVNRIQIYNKKPKRFITKSSSKCVFRIKKLLRRITEYCYFKLSKTSLFLHRVNAAINEK